MTKIKRIALLILEVVSLLLLLNYIDHGGLKDMIGSEMVGVLKLIIEFGVTAIVVTGVVVGSYLPTRRHRYYRDTQIHVLKYLSVLGLLQVLAMFMTGVFGSLPSDLVLRVPPVLLNVVMITFALMAIMMPINFVKAAFNYIKSVEHRDPRSLMRQLFD